MATCRSGAVLVSVVVLALVAGCKQRVTFEREGLEQKVSNRLQEAMARPAVDKALEEFITALAADPGFQAAGASLLEKLSADPKIAAALGEIMTSIQAMPAMQAAVMDLMARNPGVSPEQIGEQFGAQWSSALDSAQANAVFDAFGNAVMKQTDLSRVQASIAARAGSAIGGDDETRWSKRLIELNSGSTPSPTRATELFLDNVWSAPRLEKVVIALLENPTVRREIARLVSTTLADENVVSQLQRSVAVLVNDPKLRAQLLEVVSRIVANPRDDQAVATALRQVLLSTQMLDAIAKIVGVAINRPEVTRSASATLDAISADREVRRQFDTFMNDW